jgi:cell division GTPase FtsZ
MLKVGIIGVGNAGNQVAETAKVSFGIDGVAVNSSDKDISTLSHIKGIIVGDEKGAGKDRGIAKQFIRENIKDLLAESVFRTVIESNEVIFIVSSTGGGTGSGISPVLTEVLKKFFPDKKFILVGILPPIKESVAAQQNTLEYLKEVNQSEDLTYMLYDNNTDGNIKTIMERVNKDIVQDIVAIRGDFQKATPYNSIDEKDMSKIIETPGRLVVNRAVDFKEKDIDIRSVEDRIVDAVKNSSHVELERDNIVKRMGIIMNLNQKIYETVDSDLPKLKELVGEPIEGFEHIYIGEDVNRIIAVMSGMSIPDDRIEKVIQRIDDVTTQLSKKKESSVLELAQLDLLQDLRGNNNVNKQQATDLDIDDIFGKFM